MESLQGEDLSFKIRRSFNKLIRKCIEVNGSHFDHFLLIVVQCVFKIKFIFCIFVLIKAYLKCCILLNSIALHY